MQVKQATSIILEHIQQKKSQTFLLQGGFKMGQKQVMRSVLQALGHKQKADLVWISKSPDQSQLGLQDIKLVRQAVQQAAFYGGEVLVIIEDADFLSELAQNSLLKIIEEPAQDKYIFLLSNYQHLLSTVISRCLGLSLSLDNSLAGLSLGRADLADELNQSSQLRQVYFQEWDKYLTILLNKNNLAIFALVESIAKPYLEYVLFVWESVYWCLLLAQTDKSSYTVYSIPKPIRDQLDLLSAQLSLLQITRALQELQRLKPQILFTNHKTTLALEEFLLNNYPTI